MRDIADKRRKIRLASPAAGGVKIRGRWTASGMYSPPYESLSAPDRSRSKLIGVSKRQDSGVGSAFDGSQGVDSQDILNIPDIGFGSFQLFPDQNNYNTLGTGSDNTQNTGFDFNATLQEGINWINSNAASAQAWVHVSSYLPLSFPSRPSFPYLTSERHVSFRPLFLLVSIFLLFVAIRY